MLLKIAVWKYIKYNAVMVPFINSLYAVYYVFVIRYTPTQILIWVITSFPVALIMNIPIQLVVTRVVRWLK